MLVLLEWAICSLSAVDLCCACVLCRGQLDGLTSLLLSCIDLAGEAFRPVVRPLWVTASYGISWAYCIGDVAFESKKAHDQGVRGVELARFGTERAVFQAIASMAIPGSWLLTLCSHCIDFCCCFMWCNCTLTSRGAQTLGCGINAARTFVRLWLVAAAFTIHSTVNVFKKITAKAGRFQRFGPTAAGLAVIPFLPIVDAPVEHAVEWAFGKVWPSSKQHAHK